MEDGSVCEDTITFYNQLIKNDLPIGLTLQAYLHRTGKDLQKTISNGGSVRLVKGAFAENRKIALTSKREINQAFYNQSRMMLSPEAKKSGFYPIFGTHDDQMIDKINAIALENNWAKDEYEFEMLYGVRVDYQKKLVKRGYKLRVYLPYGKNWWAYAMRRVGENPKNIKYLLRNWNKAWQAIQRRDNFQEEKSEAQPRAGASMNLTCPQEVIHCQISNSKETLPRIDRRIYTGSLSLKEFEPLSGSRTGAESALRVGLPRAMIH